MTLPWWTRLLVGLGLIGAAAWSGDQTARYHLANSEACKAEDLQRELMQIYAKMDAVGSEEERNLWRPLAEKKFMEAKTHYEKAIRLYPNEPAFQVTNEKMQGLGGLFLHYAGNLPPGMDRLAYLMRVRALIYQNYSRVNNPDVLEAQLAGVYALRSQCKLEPRQRGNSLWRAAYHMGRSIDLNPGNLEAYDSLIGLYLQLDEPERAGEVAVRKAGYS